MNPCPQNPNTGPDLELETHYTPQSREDYEADRGDAAAKEERIHGEEA